MALCCFYFSDRVPQLVRPRRAKFKSIRIGLLKFIIKTSWILKYELGSTQ